MIEGRNPDPNAQKICPELDKGFEHYRVMKYAEAIELWEPLCNKADPKENNPYAEYMIAHMLETGKGYTNPDPERFLSLYKRSAEAGHQKGQQRIGEILYHGLFGVQQDFEEGVKWFRLASAQGDNQAHFSLGCAYYYGLGIEESTLLSYAWHTVAAVGGIDASHEICKILEKKMSSENISQSQRNVEKAYF